MGVLHDRGTYRTCIKQKPTKCRMPEDQTGAQKAQKKKIEKRKEKPKKTKTKEKKTKTGEKPISNPSGATNLVQRMGWAQTDQVEKGRAGDDGSKQETETDPALDPTQKKTVVGGCG
jgi:hypothetical protein